MKALDLALDMIAVKYRDAETDVRHIAASFVTSPTVEDVDRGMALVCQYLARLGGQLAVAVDEASPVTLSQWFGS
jgi:hypothetical protein